MKKRTKFVGAFARGLLCLPVHRQYVRRKPLSAERRDAPWSFPATYRRIYEVTPSCWLACLFLLPYYSAEIYTLGIYVQGNWNSLLSRISLCKPKFSVLQILHTTYPLFTSSLQENLKCRIYFHRKIQLVLSQDLSTAAKISCLYSTSKSVGEAAQALQTGHVIMI